MKDNHIFPFLWVRGEKEERIRNEIRQINSCGIHAFCVEARPHDDFAGPGWWHDMDIILDEAEASNMQVYILDDKHFPTGYANGLIEKKYPERKKQYLNFTSADVFGAKKPLELNVKNMLQPITKFWDMGKPVNLEERKNNSLVSVTALQFVEGNTFSETVMDLTSQVGKDGILPLNLSEGQWKIVVVYKTRTDGGDEAYINLIDRESAHTQIEAVYEPHYEHYKKLFGNVIAGFFSDEPQFGNYAGMEGGAIVGKKMMPMPWSEELHDMLLKKYGESLGRLLPFLWHNSDCMQKCPQFRYDYMDCVSKLYEKNFSDQIGDWCRAHGVQYIGHVVEDGSTHSRLGMGAAHYFRAMSGQDMAGVDCIGGQVVYGADTEQRTDMVDIDGEFCHYTLGRLGSSCAHLDPMKHGRAMCELFGAYGWGFGVRDQKYVLDHLLSRGINYLVPHAFSMADYPDPDCPPHYYAGGNNPEFPAFRKLMRYADRMCRALSGGSHGAQIAVLYDAEAEWSGERMAMQKVARVLQNHQYDFDFISLDMLGRQKERYHTWMEEMNGKFALHIYNEAFRVLLVPWMQRMTEELARFIEKNPSFPVIFIDELPYEIVNRVPRALPAAVQRCQTVSLENIPNVLSAMDLDVFRVSPAFSKLSCYRYRKDGRDIFFVLNEDPVHDFDGTITLPGKENLQIVSGLDGNCMQLPREENGAVHLLLHPAESCLVIGNTIRPLNDTDDTEAHNLNLAGSGCVADADREDHSFVYDPYADDINQMKMVMDLSNDWEVSEVRAINYPDFSERTQMDTLVPWSDEHRTFSGYIQYKKEFELQHISGKEKLSCEYVFEVMRVRINGEDAGTVIQPPYILSIGKYLKAGYNEIEIEVATTPARDQLNYPKPPLVLKYTALEPTGMFGRVGIFSR